MTALDLAPASRRFGGPPAAGAPPATRPRPVPPARSRRKARPWWPLARVLAAAALWSWSVARVDLDRMTDVGLVSVLPVTSLVALGLLATSFCLLLRRPDPPAGLAALHLVVLLAMFHATPALLYGSLRYSWAWKHIGIIERIQTHGAIAATPGEFSAYFSWPGFFALNAVLTDLGGRRSALAYASWAPLVSNLLWGTAVVAVVRGFTSDARLVWLAAWIFFLANWVGQDYFSPQAMNFFLFLVVLAICVRWFQPPDRSRPRPEERPGGVQRAGLVAVLVLVLVVIVSSHQLTPFMALSALSLLVAARRCRLRFLPALLALLIASWLCYVAHSFLAGNLREMVAALGRADNASAGLISLTEASPGQVLVARMDRVLSAGVWGLAALGAVRGWRRRRFEPVPVLLMVAPLAMGAANDYGGEMLFRIYLFSVPFAAYLAATLVAPRPGSVASRRWCAGVLALSLALTGAYLFAYYGKERMNRFTRAEVEASTYLADTADRGSRLVAVSSNFPWAFRDYDKFRYLWLGREPREDRQRIVDDPAGVLGDILEDERFGRNYLVLTRSQAAEIDMTGVLPPGSLPRIDAALAASDRFRVVLRNPDAVVYTAAGPR